ncbi:hypothetical protein C804_01115 [Lachnospiraceae bacterium A4]|nr:hypothetical protein C804_01115 [Lachnospiraceae bacterium A4]
MDEFLILLQAKLDEAKSKENINKTGIPNLQSQLDKLKVQVELDPKATQTLADNIGKLINQKIVISDMSVNQTQIVKTGQQIGKIISDNAKKAISNVSSKSIGKYFKVDSSTSNQFRNEMEKLVKEWTNTKGKLTDVNIQTRTSYDEKEARNIERLHQATVTYKNELDEVIKKTIAWRQIGTTTNANGEEEILRGFVEVAGRYSKSIDTASAKTDNFAKKQKETVANMQNTINQITSRVFDSNSSRPITSDSSLEKLNIQVAYVENAMYDLKNATSTTFDDAKIKVQDEISQLKILEKELRNADNISNKMKGTDVTSGISIAKNDLEKFKAEAKDFPQITQTIKDLDKAITNVGDASSLNAFNDQLRVARSELAKIKSETSTVNRNEKVGINISGLQSKIADLQRISPEINKFETEINGVKVTVQSLLADLSKINTQSDFSVVNSKWKAFTDAAKSAGIAVTDVGNSLSQSAKESSRLLKELEKSYQSIKNLQIRKSTLDPIADSSKIAKLNEEIAKEKNNYNNVFRSASANGNFDISAWKEIKSAIDSATKSKIEYNNAGKIDYLNGQKNNLSNTLSTLKSSLIENGLYTDELKQKIETLESLLVNISNKGDLSAFKTNLKSIESEIGTLSQINKIQLSFETGGYESKVETLIARTQQWTDVNGNARISTTALSTALNNLGDASKALSNNNTVENQKALIAAEKELDTQIKKVTNSIRTMNTDLAKDSAVASLHNRVQDFIGKNGKAVKYFGAELNKILNETAQGAEVSKTKLAQLEQSFGNIGVAARNAGKLGKTFFQTLREGMSSFSYWTSSTFLVMKAIQSIKGGLGTVKALDTALVDLKKTTTMTNSELDNFYYSSNKVAKQMGVTTEEIINQASAWSRLGYGSAEAATKMAKLSSQFALISPGMDVDKATSGLVSIMKAYDISVDDVLEKIESKVNIIGNNLALSNDNIVSMLQDSVSAMAEGRNTLEQTIALESAAYEIVQDNSVGNGFKTVSLRLRGLNEETQELDDSLKTIKGDLYDLTGVSVMEDADTYKSTYQILKEISEVWNSLTDKTRAEALELMFGKLRSNVGAAVLKNFSAAERAMNLMADSAGSADRELEVVTQSLDFKLNRLSETSTSVAQNLFKRDDMKTVVDGFTSVMNVIDSLTSKLGLFGSIGLGAGLFAGWKNVGIA